MARDAFERSRTVAKNDVMATITRALKKGWATSRMGRLFRRLKGYRRIFSRFDKLDALFIGFITFALIHDTLRSVNAP